MSNSKRDKISRKDVLEDLKGVASEVDGALTLEKYCDNGNYSSHIVYSKFESFNSAKEEVGLDLSKKGPGIDYTDKEIKEELERVKEEHGRITGDILRKHADFSDVVLFYRYGGINVACEELGVNKGSYNVNSDFEGWEKKIISEDMVGRFRLKDFVSKMTEGHKDRLMKRHSGFFEWVNERDNGLEIIRSKGSSSYGCRAIFINNEHVDRYKEYREMLDADQEEIFDKALNIGLSPKGIVAAIKYVNSDRNQKDVADDVGVATITIRNNRDRMMEENILS